MKMSKRMLHSLCHSDSKVGCVWITITITVFLVRYLQCQGTFISWGRMYNILSSDLVVTDLFCLIS